MNKIKEKLTGGSSSKGSGTEDASKLQKSYGSSGTSGTSGTGSSLQNPITSSGGQPTGSALSSSGATSGATTSGIGRDGYGTQGGSSYPTQSAYPPTSSSTMAGSGMPPQSSTMGGSGYPTQSSSMGREGYSTQSSNALGSGGAYPTQSSGTTSSQPPGAFPGDERSYGSGGTGTTSSGYGAPRQPMDPYSSGGQEAAADSWTSRGGTTTSGPNFSRGEDPNVSRSAQGGVLNQTSDRYPSSGSYDREAYPTSGATMGSSTHPTTTTTHGPTTTTTSTSSHHYGRDAAMVGGAGALGGGAAGYGASQYGQSSSREPGMTQQTYGEPGMVSHHGGHGMEDPRITSQQPMTGQSTGPQYVSRDTYGQTGGQPMQGTPIADSMGSQTSPTTSSSGMGGSTDPAGLPQSKKMGSAYEAGYRDAMEHMQAEMRKQ